MLEKVWIAVAAVVITALVVFGFWVYYIAPCSWLQFEPAKDLPGRCVTYFRGP